MKFGVRPGGRGSRGVRAGLSRAAKTETNKESKELDRPGKPFSLLIDIFCLLARTVNLYIKKKIIDITQTITGPNLSKHQPNHNSSGKHY